MLQKMGYKGGGLGAQGQGIKTAIQAVKRAEKEGLGARPEPKQSLGGADDRKEAKEKEAPQKQKKLHNWRVRIDEKPRRARRVYKTAEEIREEAEAGSAPQPPAAPCRGTLRCGACGWWKRRSAGTQAPGRPQAWTGAGRADGLPPSRD